MKRTRQLAATAAAVLLALLLCMMAYAAPEKVSGVSVTRSASGALTVSWNAQTNADGYSVYMAEGSADAAYSCLTSVTGASYTKKNLTAGKTYYFKIRAYQYKTGTTTKVFGSFSTPVGETVNAGTPIISSVSSETTGTLTARWSKVSGASGYSVYYAGSENGSYTCLASTDKEFYTKKNLTLGKTYYFKVRAYSYAGSTKLFGQFSPVVKGYCTVANPSGINAAGAGVGKAYIQWSRVEGADGYSLYMADSADGDYPCILGTTATNYTKTGLASGKTYYFKVRAYATQSGKKIFGAYSRVANVTPTLAAPVISEVYESGSNAMTVRWNSSSEADGYSIYMAESADGTYSCLNSVTGTSYTKKGLTLGKTYYFKVRAYAVKDGRKTFGAFSGVKSCLCSFGSPRVTSVSSAGTGKLAVKWSAVADAAGYSVYMSESQNGSYACLTSVTGTSYTKANLTGGRDYYFKIRAYRMRDGAKVFSGFSDVYQATANLKKTTLRSVTGTASKALTVTWDAVKNADGYSVYMATGSSDSYTCLASVTGTGYTKGKLTPSASYSFKVRPYLLVNGSKVFGAFSDPMSGTASLGVPALSVTGTSDDQLTVSWAAVDGADGYSVYMARGLGGEYTCLASTASTEYTKSGLSAGGTYLFKVRSYLRKSDGSRVFSAFSEPVPGVCTRTVPVVSEVRTAGGMLRASWGDISGASAYRVYLSEYENEGYWPAATTSQCFCEIGGLVPGQTYYVRVAACFERDGTLSEGRQSDARSGEFTATDGLHLTAVGTASGKITLNWDAMDGMDGYNVYLSTDGLNGEYTCISTVTGGTTYTKAALESGKAYYFRLKPFYYETGSSRKNFSDDSYPAKGLTGMDKASLRAPATGGEGEVALNWGAVGGAQYYEVAACETEDGSYATVADGVTGLTCTAGGLICRPWYFRVRAYYVYAGQRVCGAWSDARIGYPGLGTPSITGITREGSGKLTLNWSGVTGASGYSLYWADSADGEFTALYSTAETSFTKPALEMGKTYYFKVRAYYASGSTKIFSAYSDVSSQSAGLSDGAITDLAYINGQGIRVTWTNPVGANACTIYRKGVTETDWREMATVENDTVWLDADVTAGETYRYAVQSVCVNSYGTTRGSEPGEGVEIRAELPSFTVTNTTLPLNGAYTHLETYNADTNAYYAVRSYLDRLDEVGGGTLYVARGDYQLYGAWYISSNVHVVLEEGVRLFRNSTSSWFEFVSQRDLDNGVLYSGYNGVHDASLTCPVAGGASLMNGDSGAGLVIIHTRHILLDGIAFRGSTGTNHNIELDGSEDVEIRNCLFDGNAADVDIGNAKEAINLDIPDINTEGVVCRYTAYDKTATKDIYIHHNRFLNQLNGVGSHMYTDTSPHVNIRIEYNEFENSIYQAIGANNWITTVIKGNTFRNCGRVKSDETGTRFFMLMLDGVRDIRIEGNSFTDGAYFAGFRVSRYSEQKSDVLQGYERIPSVLTEDEMALMYSANTFDNVEYPYIYWYDEDYNVSVLRPAEDTGSTFTVSPDSEPYYRKYTAANTPNYNGSTACYYMLRSYLEALEAVGGGTLVLEPGEYNVTNQLYIPSDTSVVLQKGATVRKSTDTGTSGLTASSDLFYFLPPSESGSLGRLGEYAGTSDASLTGEGVIDMNGVTGSAVVIPQASGVTVSGLTFTGIGSSRYVAVRSSRDVTIEGCAFNHNPGSDTRGVTLYTKYNGVPCRNVAIKSCTFDGVGYGVQSADTVANTPTDGLTVENCSFLTCTSRSVSFDGVKNLFMTGNSFYNGDEETILSGGTVTAVQLGGVESMNIAGNSFDGFSYVMRFNVTDNFPENAFSESDLDEIIESNTFANTVSPYIPYVLRQGEGTKKCYFTKLTSTVIRTAGSPALRTVSLTWDEVANAEGYSVYRSLTRDGEYAYFAGTTGTSYTGSGLTAGETYYWKVAGYFTVEGAKVYGEKSAPAAVTVKKLDAATGLTTSSDTTGKITLSWNSVTEADGYNVYISESKDGEYTCFNSVTGLSTTKGSLTNGSVYWFKVRAYRLDDSGSKVFAEDSAPVAGIAGPAQPVPSVSPSGSGSVLLSWSDVSGARAYEVYVSEDDGATYDLAGTTEVSCYIVSGLAKQKYFFKVRAFCVLSGVQYFGSFSGVRNSFPGIDVPENLLAEASGATAMTISWNAVEGADGYNVYMSETENGEYTCINSVASTATRKASLSRGTRYWFKVRAYYLKDDGSKQFGDYSDAVSGVTDA